MAFTYRAGLGRPLTYQEMDDNLEHVETLAGEAEGSASAATSAAGAAQNDADQAQIYAAAAQAAAGIPALDGNAGRVLGVSSDEQGVEFLPRGTAAVLDVTTTSSDTTAGRVLKVGDFALPTNSDYRATGATENISDTTDWNTITSAGWYKDLLGGSGPNGPGGHAPYYYCQVMRRGGNATQVAFPYNTHGALGTVKFRSLYQSAWGPWQELLQNDRQATDNVSGTYTCNLALDSIFDLTLTGNTTLSVSNIAVSGEAVRSFVVRIRQGATARTLTWWQGITWLSPATPAAPAANKMVEYVLSYTAASGWLGRVGAGN